MIVPEAVNEGPSTHILVMSLLENSFSTCLSFRQVCYGYTSPNLIFKNINIAADFDSRIALVSYNVWGGGAV